MPADRLVGVLAQREVSCWHGHDVECTIKLVIVGVRPLAAEGGNLGAVDGVREPHTQEVAGVSGTGAVGETITTVKDTHVRNEVYVTGLGRKAELRSASDLLNGVEGLHLLGRQGGEVRFAWVRSRAKEGSTAKIELDHAVLLEDNWTALVSRESERPVSGSQDSDEVRAGSRQDVIDSSSRGDHTATTSLGSSAGKPGDDISSLFCVERL